MHELNAAQKALRDVLITARKEANVTQRELAQRVNLIQSILAKIELGERQISLFEFIAIARALELEPSKLLTKIMRLGGL